MHSRKSAHAGFTDAALKSEAHAIAHWWSSFCWDQKRGRFFGEIDHANRAVPGAEIGVVLVTRILWFFSEATRLCEIADGRQMAERAFHFFQNGFFDEVNGGVYWSLGSDQGVADASKKTYAQAFGIYALCAYYRLTRDEQAKRLAFGLFEILEARCKDRVDGGYLETFARDWSEAGDIRLSEFDLHAPKSMNAHLHVLEAYSALHLAFPGQRTCAALRESIDLFTDRVVEPGSRYLNQFFTRAWGVEAAPISHGHDIEASWLLWKAAEASGCRSRQAIARDMSVTLAEHCLRTATLASGAVINETTSEGVRDEASIWWVQAEGMVGFLNAFELSGREEFFDAAAACWDVAQRQHFDHEFGEWRWFAHGQNGHASRSYKAGMWKGPYHNGRAMLEGVERLSRIEKDGKRPSMGKTDEAGTS